MALSPEDLPQYKDLLVSVKELNPDLWEEISQLRESSEADVSERAKYIWFHLLRQTRSE